MLCRRSSLRFLASLFSAFAKHRFSKPLRYLTKLVLAKPFHRKSRHFFSLPCQCIRSKTLPQRNVTVHRFSFANHISAFLCHSFASHCSASYAFALPVCASQCHCTAVHLIAFAKRCRAMPSPRLSSRPDAMPLLRFAMLCLCASSQIAAMPLQCKSLLRCAKPSHGQSNSALPWQRRSQRCDALALRLSPHRQCK